jgi:hypothetical protein
MLQRVAWSVAALVMMINGYLLIDFFVSEVTGLLFGLVVATGTVAYIAFIVYLILHSGAFPSDWITLISKRFTFTGN